jgi:hypothetical protein
MLIGSLEMCGETSVLSTKEPESSTNIMENLDRFKSTWQWVTTDGYLRLRDYDDDGLRGGSA